MARNESRRSHIRYGVCLNDGCSKAKNKIVQEISGRKEMICDECQKPLRECPPPKKSNKGLIIGVIAGVVVIAGGIVAYTQLGGKSTVDKVPEDDTTTVVQTPESMPDPKTTPAPLPEPDPNADLNLEYGDYYGQVVDGKPHGTGTIVYRKATKIVSSKDYVAQPGEKVNGTFRNGKLNTGTWYQSNGNETAIIN